MLGAWNRFAVCKADILAESSTGRVSLVKLQTWLPALTLQTLEGNVIGYITGYH
jgi:hypothetical protein